MNTDTDTGHWTWTLLGHGTPEIYAEGSVTPQKYV